MGHWSRTAIHVQSHREERTHVRLTRGVRARIRQSTDFKIARNRPTRIECVNRHLHPYMHHISDLGIIPDLRRVAMRTVASVRPESRRKRTLFVVVKEFAAISSCSIRCRTKIDAVTSGADNEIAVTYSSIATFIDFK